MTTLTRQVIAEVLTQKLDSSIEAKEVDWRLIVSAIDFAVLKHSWYPNIIQSCVELSNLRGVGEEFNVEFAEKGIFLTDNFRDEALK